MPVEQEHLHVAVGVIRNDKGQILVSKRHKNQDHGGLWEFPGGKLKPGEKIQQTLVRELKEELGIQTETSRPLIKVRHDYPDYSVLLDVWQVIKFSGEAAGCEGQKISWMDKESLRSRKFPQANYHIISAINLPSVYFITPDPDYFNDEAEYLSGINRVLAHGYELVQFRAKKKPLSIYQKLIPELQSLCKKHKARLLINGVPEDIFGMESDGLHLSSESLMRQSERPITNDKLLSVSCHNSEELKKAERINADCIILGPVSETASHPGATAMGWDAFSELVEQVNIPVYALGGMKQDDLKQSWNCGAQGIAMLSGLWNGNIGG